MRYSTLPSRHRPRARYVLTCVLGLAAACGDEDEAPRDAGADAGAPMMDAASTDAASAPDAATPPDAVEITTDQAPMATVVDVAVGALAGGLPIAYRIVKASFEPYARGDAADAIGPAHTPVAPSVASTVGAPTEMAMDAGLYEDPGDDPNVALTAPVVPPRPL